MLQEIYVNVTRKIATRIAKADTRSLVAAYVVWCIDVSAQDVSAAFRIEDESKIGFWDALILASAARSGAVRLLSEDLNDGQTNADVRVENPFARC